jgi:hypothetical protein
VNHDRQERAFGAWIGAVVLLAFAGVLVWLLGFSRAPDRPVVLPEDLGGRRDVVGGESLVVDGSSGEPAASGSGEEGAEARRAVAPQADPPAPKPAVTISGVVGGVAMPSTIVYYDFGRRAVGGVEEPLLVHAIDPPEKAVRLELLADGFMPLKLPLYKLPNEGHADFELDPAPRLELVFEGLSDEVIAKREVVVLIEFDGTDQWTDRADRTLGAEVTAPVMVVHPRSERGGLVAVRAGAVRSGASSDDSGARPLVGLPGRPLARGMRLVGGARGRTLDEIQSARDVTRWALIGAARFEPGQPRVVVDCSASTRLADLAVCELEIVFGPGSPPGRYWISLAGPLEEGATAELRGTTRLFTRDEEERTTLRVENLPRGAYGVRVVIPGDRRLMLSLGKVRVDQPTVRASRTLALDATALVSVHGVEPRVGVSVQATTEDGEPLFEQHFTRRPPFDDDSTSPDGVFRTRLESLPAGVVWLRATAGGESLISRRERVVLEPNRETAAALELVPSGRVRIPDAPDGTDLPFRLIDPAGIVLAYTLRGGRGLPTEHVVQPGRHRCEVGEWSKEFDVVAGETVVLDVRYPE